MLDWSEDANGDYHRLTEFQPKRALSNPNPNG